MEVSKEHFEIDPANINSEINKQSSLYHFYADQAVEAREKRDSIANKLKREEANFEIAFRLNPPQDVKLTESVVAAYIAADPELCNIRDKLVQANKDLGTFESATRSMEHKCKMLELSVRMILSRSNGFAERIDDGVSNDFTQDEIRRKLNR